MAQAEERNLKQSFPREYSTTSLGPPQLFQKYTVAHPSWGRQTRKCATRCVNREGLVNFHHRTDRSGKNDLVDIHRATPAQSSSGSAFTRS